MPVPPPKPDASPMRSDHPTIICAVDGSTGSDIVRIAARVAELVGAELEVVHVLGAHRSSAVSACAPIAVSSTAGGGLAGEEDQRELLAIAMLDDLCAAAEAEDAARRVIRYGDPARRVAAVAHERAATMIVVGARADRRDGDSLIGSVSSRLAADAPCPVLVIPARLERHVRPQDWRRRTLVSGFDGSPSSWSAARHAAALAHLIKGSLSVVSVGTEVRRADVVDGLDGAVPVGDDGLPTVDLRHQHRAGDPAWELERVATAITAPLIAIGSRGLGPWKDALLGAVARRLLQSARRPILVLPATATGAPA
jgi:nucleotide-binding universal stress UspA family protein